MTDWQDVLKATTQDLGADVAGAQQRITEFEKNTLTKEIDAYLKTQPAGSLNAFKIVVNPKAATSGMSGDTYTISTIYTDAKYQVKTSMLGMGKTLKVTIPNTQEVAGQKITDPRRLAAIDQMPKWKQGLRRLNPARQGLRNIGRAGRQERAGRGFMAQAGNTGQSV
jgi:hypothetical protein